MKPEVRANQSRGMSALPTRLTVGDLSVTLTEAGLGPLVWRGVELLRGTTYPVRDADWGTAPAHIDAETVEQTDESLAVRRQFTVWDDALQGRFEMDATRHGTVEIRLIFDVKRQVTVSRAGFTLLHPIVGLAGEPLEVVHPDGTFEATRFPRAIWPSQPARDIAGLRYGVGGCTIDIRMVGDVFEMEDQRNWSDASYKTYCRPLSLPYPYAVAVGETIEQTISITLGGGAAEFSARGESAAPVAISHDPAGETVPATALAVERGWARPLPGLAGIPLLIRLDLDNPDLSLLDGIDTWLDLELVISDDLPTAQHQLTELAAHLERDGRRIATVTALPRAYLKSYQPDATWPTGATPAELVAAARTAFPSARIGGGMLTNFTELNRHQPDPSAIDYLTHGSSATVHAADDISVFQTLEALPHIFESARGIAPDIPYRLGLISIGMRTNPYGAGLSDNPDGVLKTMTDDDPRMRTRVGAAWMVAAFAATHGFGVEQVSLAAPHGPFGIMAHDGGVRPAFHVIRALHAMAGLPRTDRATGPLAIVSARDGGVTRAVAANVGAEETGLVLGSDATAAILDETAVPAASDPSWLDDTVTPAHELRLAPYDIAFVSVPSDGGAT